mgnify:CR=1 FL=1
MNPFTIEEQERMPEHVAIIMDGNGRWAQSKGKPRLFGHRNGVENVRSVVNTARELGIPYVTLYAFSQENQSRPVAEKSGLMKLLEEFLKIELKSMVRDGIRLGLLVTSMDSRNSPEKWSCKLLKRRRQIRTGILL